MGEAGGLLVLSRCSGTTKASVIVGANRPVRVFLPERPKRKSAKNVVVQAGINTSPSSLVATRNFNTIRSVVIRYVWREGARPPEEKNILKCARMTQKRHPMCRAESMVTYNEDVAEGRMHPPTSSSLETHDPCIPLSRWTDKRGIPERPEVSGVPGFSWKIVMRTCYVCERA